MAAAKRVIDFRKEEIENDAIAKSEFLSIMAHKHRLHILLLLSKGEYSLSELTRELNETTVALSRHLMILRENNIITGRRHGKMVRYSLTSEKVARMIDIVADLYSSSGNVSEDNDVADEDLASRDQAEIVGDNDDAGQHAEILAALLRNLYPSPSES